MKLTKSQIFNIAVFLIGVFVISGLISHIGWDKTKAHLSMMGLSFLWLFPIYFVTMIGDTVSWKLLIRNKVSMLRIIMVANSGTAINALTPSGDGGEFVKGNLIKDDIGGPESVSSLLLWNFVYAVTKKITMFAGILLYMIFKTDSDKYNISPQVEWGFLLAAILTSGYLLIIFLLIKKYGVERAAKLLHKLPIIKNHEPEKILEFAKKVDDAFESFAGKHKYRLILSGVFLIISHLSVSFEIWFVLNSIGMEISMLTSLFLFSGSVLLGTLVSFSPVEMGISEAGSMGLYKLMGFDPLFGFMQEFIRRLRRLVFNVIGLLYLGARAFFPSFFKTDSSD